jgi:hypothetical protein
MYAINCADENIFLLYRRRGLPLGLLYLKQFLLVQLPRRETKVFLMLRKFNFKLSVSIIDLLNNL